MAFLYGARMKRVPTQPSRSPARGGHRRVPPPAAARVCTRGHGQTADPVSPGDWRGAGQGRDQRDPL